MKRREKPECPELFQCGSREDESGRDKIGESQNVKVLSF